MLKFDIQGSISPQWRRRSGHRFTPFTSFFVSFIFSLRCTTWAIPPSDPFGGELGACKTFCTKVPAFSVNIYTSCRCLGVTVLITSNKGSRALVRSSVKIRFADPVEESWFCLRGNVRKYSFACHPISSCQRLILRVAFRMYYTKKSVSLCKFSCWK
jgi:hypothetical protein